MENIYIADWYTEDKKPGELTQTLNESNDKNLTVQFNYGEGYIGLR